MVAFLTLGLDLCAQDSAKVRFYIKGSADIFLQVNGKLLPYSNAHVLPVGTHDLQIWSPMYTLFDGKIEVPAKDSISFYQELKKDPAYISHQFAMDDYKRRVFIGKTAPLLVSITGAALTPLLHFSRKRWHEEKVIAEFQDEYYASDQAGVESITARYNTTNTLYFTSIGLAVGGLATHLILRKWVNNLEKPVYRQTNPFTLEAFEVSWNSQVNSPQAGVTIQF